MNIPFSNSHPTGHSEHSERDGNHAIDAIDAIEQLRAALDEQHGKLGRLYANTYYSLLDRIEPDGYFPESITGQYPGMFMRSVGSMASLLMETAQYSSIEAMLRYCVNGMERYGMRRMPHFLNRTRTDSQGKLLEPEVCKDDQIDGQAHVVMAWARLAVARGRTAFEDETYGRFAALMDDCLDMPYFYYAGGPYEPGVDKYIRLIHNFSFEHSREIRRWQAFDLLSQCFVGAAAEAMIPLARRRGDEAAAALWEERLGLLRTGVADNLTRTVDGRMVYLEMLLPDGYMGQPYTGMGWVNLSPLAAQWEPLETDVLRNTVARMRKRLWVDDPMGQPLKCLLIEYDEQHELSYQLIGKGIGWYLDYCRKEQEYDQIAALFAFLDYYHDTPVYMENMSLVEGRWRIVDAGNGEQASWWCWSMARLRKQLGLSPAPARI